jgi:hypothetical protein
MEWRPAAGGGGSSIPVLETTVASLPPATNVDVNDIVYVSDATGTDYDRFAISDGSNWRYLEGGGVNYFGNLPTYEEAVLALDQIRAYFPLEEAAGAVVTDISPAGHTGTIGAGVTLALQGPQAGTSAMGFNGEGTDYIDIADAAGITFNSVDDASGAYGIEIWVRIDAGAAGYDPFVDRGGFVSYLLREDGTDQIWRWDDFDTNYALARSTWHQICYDYLPSTTTERIMVDGGGVGKTFERVQSIPWSGTKWRLGQNVDGIHALDGRLARFFIKGGLHDEADVALRWQVGST